MIPGKKQGKQMILLMKTREKIVNLARNISQLFFKDFFRKINILPLFCALIAKHSRSLF